MMTYLVPLLAIVLLCACWGVFQLWLSRHDPDAHRRSLKCGNCGCEGRRADSADKKKAAPEGAAGS